MTPPLAPLPLLFFFALAACAATPTATATATATATSTPTPTSTSTATSTANATPTAPPPLAPLDEQEVARLEASPVALRSNLVPPGKSERYGHAEIMIHGSADEVRKVIVDFSHYKDIVPRKFKNAHVVAKENGHTDLHMQVPIMNGMIVLWDILRFGPIVPTEQGERLEGTFVRGNVKDADIVMTMRPIGPRQTVLKCDLLILPKVFAPQAAIDEELRDAAGDALDGIKARVETPPASPTPGPA